MTEEYLDGIEQSVLAYGADELVFPAGKSRAFRQADPKKYPNLSKMVISEAKPPGEIKRTDVDRDFATYGNFVEFRRGGIRMGRMLIP